MSTGDPRADFHAAWREADAVYETYARTVGWSYAALHVLSIVHEHELAAKPCTQAELVRRTHAPKQTVSSVVAGLRRDGLVTLAALDSDRRSKAIELTDTGRTEAEHLAAPIARAEAEAFGSLSGRERTALATAMRHYQEALATALLASS